MKRTSVHPLHRSHSGSQRRPPSIRSPPNITKFYPKFSTIFRTTSREHTLLTLFSYEMRKVRSFFFSFVDTSMAKKRHDMCVCGMACRMLYIMLCYMLAQRGKWATVIDFSCGNSNRGWYVKEVQGHVEKYVLPTCRQRVFLFYPFCFFSLIVSERVTAHSSLRKFALSSALYTYKS